MSDEGATCGDYGGVRSDGDPCTRKAGWGRDDVEEGTCKDHTDEKAAKLHADKEEFLELIVGDKGSLLSLRAAAQRIGWDQSTVWRWRQEDPEFDRAVEKAKETRDVVRLETLADSSFARAVRGDAAASLEMFWLTNLARRVAKRREGEPEFLHRQQMEVTGKGGDAIEVADISPDRVAGALSILAGEGPSPPDVPAEESD